jgi:hypothetical protein
MSDIAKEAGVYQIELFQMVAEFWGRATRMPPDSFEADNFRRRQPPINEPVKSGIPSQSYARFR